MGKEKYLIRTRLSGVWVNCEILPPNSALPLNHHVVMTGRRLWSWAGAAECTQIAKEGPKSGNCGMVCLPTALMVVDIAEVQLMSPAAIAAVDAMPEWRHDDSD